MTEYNGVPVPTTGLVVVVVVIVQGSAVSNAVGETGVVGIQVNEGLSVIDGVCVISIVIVNTGEGVGDINGDVVDDGLDPGVGDTIRVTVRDGLGDGMASSEGVDVPVDTVAVGFSGVILDVPDGDIGGLGVIVADGL